MTKTRLPQDAEALETRFAMRLAAGLTERAAATPHDISERLRFAREKALARARESRQANTVTLIVAGGRGLAVLGGPPAWWQRVASVLPLLVLAAGLLFISERVTQEQVLAAAEIDAVLLADDLPPEAYSDPGFAEFLKTPQP
jgi:Protein of unknown function (DUF3619)